MTLDVILNRIMREKICNSQYIPTKALGIKDPMNDLNKSHWQAVLYWMSSPKLHGFYNSKSKAKLPKSPEWIPTHCYVRICVPGKLSTTLGATFVNWVPNTKGIWFNHSFVSSINHLFTHWCIPSTNIYWKKTMSEVFF